MLSRTLEEEFESAKATALEVADRGTLLGIEEKGLVCISRSLFDRLMADSIALQRLANLAQQTSWTDSIERFHSDGGAI